MGRKKKTGTFDEWFSNYSQQNGIDVSGAPSSGTSYSNAGTTQQKKKTATFNDWFTNYQKENNIDLTQQRQTPSYTQQAKRYTNKPVYQQSQTPSYASNPLAQAAQNVVNNARNAASYVVNGQRQSYSLDSSSNGDYKTQRNMLEQQIRQLQSQQQKLQPDINAIRDINEVRMVGDTKTLEKWDRYNDIEKKISELQSQNKELSRQNKLSEFYQEAKNADYAQNSQYRTTANGRKIEYGPEGAGLLETGFDDLTYDYINKNKDAIYAKLQNTPEGEMLAGLDNIELSQMNDDEVAMFNYLYSKDKDRAYDFVDTLRPDLLKRQAEADQQEWSDLTKDSFANRVLLSAITVPGKMFGNVAATAGMAIDKAQGNEIDTNASYLRANRINNTIRQTAGQETGRDFAELNAKGLMAQEAHQAYLSGQDMDQALNDIYTEEHLEELIQTNFGQKLQEFGNTFYGSVMSQADNMYNLAVTGGAQGAALVLMSASAFPDAMVQAKERGLTDQQAFSLGIIAASAEYITERVSMEALFDMERLANEGLARYIGVNMLTEGSEEVASDFINFVAEEIVAGDKSEFRLKIAQYEAQGLSHDDAVKAAWADQVDQMLNSFIGGALAGGGMAGGFAAGQMLNTVQMEQLGKQIKESLPATSPLHQADDIKLAEFYVNIQQTRQADQQSQQIIEQAIDQLRDTGNVTAETVAEVMSDENTLDILEGNRDLGEGIDVNESNKIWNEEDLKNALIEYAESQQEAPAVQSGDIFTAEENTMPAARNANMGESVLQEQGLFRSNKTTADVQNDNDVIQGVVNNFRNGGMNNAAAVFEANYNDTYDAKTYTQAATEIAKAAYSDAGVPVTTGLDQNVAQLLYDAVRQDLGRSRTNVGENVRLQRNTGRLISEDTGRQSESLGSRTEETSQEIRSDRHETTNERNAGALQTKQVTAKSLGLTNGTDASSVNLMTNNLPEGLKRIQGIGSRRNVEFHFFTGGNLTMQDAGEVRAAISYQNGKTQSFVRADHPVYSPEQLSKHELSHDGIDRECIRTGLPREVVVNNRFDRVNRKFGGFINSEMLPVYEAMYEGSGLKTWQIKEEMLCDMAAGMNEFDQVEALKDIPDLLPGIQAIVGMMSREFNEQLMSEEIGETANETRGSPKVFNSAETTGAVIDLSNVNELSKRIEQSPGQKKYAVIKDYILEVLGGRSIKMSDGTEAVVDNKDLGHLAKDAGQKKTAYLSEIKRIVETAVFRADTEGETVDHPKFDFFKYYEAKVKYGGETYSLYIDVGRGKFDKTFHLYDITETGSAADRINGLRSARSSLRESDTSLSENNISQPSDIINPEVKENLEEHGTGVGDNYVVKTSLDSWNKTDINAIKDGLLKAGYEPSEINKWIKNVNGVAATVLANRTRLDYEADEFQSALKPNSDYFYTLDLSTLCKKRLLYQGTYNAIMHRLKNVALMPEDTINLRRMMDDMGYEVPCGICYEESRKKNEGKYAERWLEGYEKWKGYKNQKHDDPYVPTLDKVTTTDGRAWLRKNHPEALESYLFYQRTRGNQNPKVSFTHTDYRGEILNMTDSDIRDVKHIGGLRIQSFSDFETIHTIDMMQAVMDMAAKNLTAQAYTKVPAFADIFGGTGIKINLSLIGQVRNGKLVFDAKEGIDPKEAFRLRKKYSKNVGTILVGANYESIMAAMADPRVDMIIPFHRSGWSGEEYEKLGLKGYKDYTDGQTERYLINGKNVSLADASKILGLTKGNELEGIYSEDYWDYSKTGKENAEAYLKLCAEKNYRPVFYQFLHDNGDGSWSLQEDGSTDGYWKMLTDYKMYDNDGIGAPQHEVVPNFDMRAANKYMKEYDGNPNTLPVAQDVVDKFVKEFRQKSKNTKYSREIGYHAGDLGKSEALSQQGSGRDTGHFGTGTYFVGNEARIKGYNSRNGQAAPTETVDFSQYNLFKPKSYSDALALHDFMRYVDGSIGLFSGAKTTEEYNELNDQLYDASEEFSENGAQEVTNDIDDYFFRDNERSETARSDAEIIDDVIRLADNTIGRRMLIDTITKHSSERDTLSYDESYIYDEQGNRITPNDYLKGLPHDEAENIIDWITTEADDRRSFGRERTERYERWRDRFGDVANILGISESELESVITEATEEADQINYPESKTADSIATRVMKRLGYEGVDVRHIDQMDNTTYGSVIYDLKGEDLARKKEIGTARFSKETDSNGRRLTKEQIDYFKNSKVVDDNGNLLVMYHGTGSAGFTVFDPRYSDDKRSLFFTDERDVAEGYSASSAMFSPAKKHDAGELNELIQSISGGDNYIIRQGSMYKLMEVGPVGQDDLVVMESENIDDIQNAYVDDYINNMFDISANYEVYLNLTNPLILDAEYNEWDELEDLWGKEITDGYNYIMMYNDLGNDQYEVEYSDFDGDGTKVMSRADLESILKEYEMEKFLHGDEVQNVYIDEDGQRVPATTRDYAEYAQINGYDGVILKNISDNGVYGGQFFSNVAIAFNSNQVKDVNNLNPTDNPDIRFSRETDPNVLRRLENEETVTVYRAMQEIDGKLYPPMAAKVSNEAGGKRQLVEPTEFGEWYRADERPDLVRDGKFVLDKANGTSLEAAYNPYWHTSRSLLNDQFSSAYKRPNLVTVECEVPVSELTSGYRAEGAKDAVGEMSWHSGPVSSKLAKLGNGRRVILSRWVKVNRIVPDAEAASAIADMLNGTDIKIPANTVTPSLRSELEKYGVMEPVTRTSRENSYSFALPEDIQKIVDAYDDLESQYNELFKENKKNKERAEYFKGETRLNVYSENPQVSSRDATKIAQSFIKDYELEMDEAELSKKIKQYAEDFRSGKKSFGELAEAVLPIATEMAENAKIVIENPEKAITDHIWKTKILVSDKVRSDIADYGDWKRQYNGRLKLSTATGIPIEDFYSELQEAYGTSIFPDQFVNPTDQLMAIAGVVDDLQPTEEFSMFAPYQITEASRSISLDLMQDIMDMQLHKTFADKQKEARMELKKELQAKANAALKDLRAQRDEKIAKLKEHYRQVASDRRTAKLESADRTKLLNVMKRLDKMSKHTDDVRKGLIQSLVGDFDLVAKSITGGKVASLEGLSSFVDKMMEKDPLFRPTERTMKELQRLNQRHISDMDIDDVRELTQALLNLEKEFRDYRKLIDTQYKTDVITLGNQIIEGIQKTKGIGNSKIGVFNWFQKAYDTALATPVIRPETEVLRLVGFDRSNPLYQLMYGTTDSLASGQREMVRYKWQANSKYLDEFLNDQKFAKEIMGKTAKEYKITGRKANGKTVTLSITPDMLMALYMHMQNEHNFHHFGEWTDERDRIKYGHGLRLQHGDGITIPDFDLYKKGKKSEAYRVAARNGNKLIITMPQLKAAMKQLTDKEMKFIKTAQKYYSEMSQPRINEVSNKLFGYSIATVENYFRINTDSDYRGTDMDAIKYDGTIEGVGWTKERLSDARNAILLIPLTEQFARDIDAHAKYVGMAVPVRNFNKVYGVNRATVDKHGNWKGTESSVQSTIHGIWGDNATDYIKKLMSDVQNPKTTSEAWSKILSRLRGNYAGSVLALNAGVAIKQAASYPTAAAVIGWKPLIKAFGNTRLQGKMDMNVVNKYSPLMYLRTQGMGYQELADLKNLSNGWLNRALNSKALNWIQDMDVMTIKKLWKAAEYYVQDTYSDLKVGTEEYYQKVGEVHSEIIEKTQPNYTTLQRGEILRSDNELVRTLLGMFKTQPFQNASILFEAVGEFNANLKRYQANPDEHAKAALKLAGKKLSRAVSSQLVASIVFAVMQAAWDWVRGRDDKYKDKEGKLSFASAFKQIAINMGSNAFGMIPLGSVAYELAEAYVDHAIESAGGEKVFNATAYGLDASAATGIINDLETALITMVEDWTSEDKSSKKAKEKRIRNRISGLADFAQAAGYPADNLIKDAQALAVNVFRTLGATGSMNKYEAEYYSKRIFSVIDSSSKKEYMDILYRAYDNDKDAYNKLYSIYIENDGFATAKKTSKEYIDEQMRTHKKKSTMGEQRESIGTSGANAYGDIMSSVQSTPAWSRANDDQKRYAEQWALGLTAQDSTKDQYSKAMDVIEGGKSYGLTASDYVAYKMALQVADKDKNKSYSQEEVKAALEMIGISQREKAYLYEKQNKTWAKNNPYK